MATKRNKAENKADLFARLGIEGEKFGGGNDFLNLAVGAVAGPFAHKEVLKNVKLTDDTQPVDIFVGIDDAGIDIRMPASAIFRRNAEAAHLQPGDEYYVAREEDAIKKKGAGKNKPMKVFSVLVTKRAK